VSECWLTPKEQFVSYVMAKACCFRWNYICFVLYQHP